MWFFKCLNAVVISLAVGSRHGNNQPETILTWPSRCSSITPLAAARGHFLPLADSWPTSQESGQLMLGQEQGGIDRNRLVSIKLSSVSHLSAWQWKSHSHSFVPWLTTCNSRCSPISAQGINGKHQVARLLLTQCPKCIQSTENWV